ncbi:MAG: RagB/SusD family nutrient uptake outer membrane protein [Bacteroidales bacterium]|nr:RagB/SusD family nutrient uptake outer membrane protein [Bacteroidales bacterium]
MMRSIIKNLTVFIAIFLIGSCESYLDITPKDRLSEAQYYQTEQDAIEVVTSCYDPLKHPGGFNINFFFMFTTFSDRAVHEAAAVNQFTFDASYSRVLEIYTYMSKGIFRCNLAFEKIPPIEMDEGLKEELLAQVHFLRGLYNFYMTTIYNEPPLIDYLVKDVDQQFENSSREEFKRSIISDMKIAAEGLPAAWDDANLGRATRGAALAMIGKTYLYFQQWDSAKIYLQQVKDMADNDNVYGLLMPKGTDSLDYCYAYQANFSAIDLTTPSGNTYDSENNLESIFEIQFHYGGWQVWEGGWQADGSLTDLYFGPEGYKNLAPTAEYRDQFEETPDHPAGLKDDPRRYVMFFEPGDTIYYIDQTVDPIPWEENLNMNGAISEGFGWAKYFNPAHQSNNGPTNLRLIRYADVLLMLAEADFMSNGESSSQLGLDCINAVRQRAGLEGIETVTREAIMHERDIELGFEWFRFFDLVRWSMLEDPWVDIEEMIPYFQKGKNEYLPIPLYEINLARETLKQNPGW